MKTRFTRKAAAIVIMSIFALAALATTTFAWFSVNKTAEAADVEFETIAPSNMVMAVSPADPTDPTVWKNIQKINKNFDLSPASTVNCEDFFAPVNGSYLGSYGQGDIVTDSSATKFKQDAKGYYVDQVFYIKAQESNSVKDYNVYLSKFTIVASEKHLEDCIRIAILPVSRDATTTLVVGSDGFVTSHASIGSNAIYAYDEETEVNPVKGIDSVDSTAILNGTDVIDLLDNKTTLFTVDGEAKEWTTIIVRVWIEGQHEDCLNELADEKVTISLEFSVKELNK